MYDQNIILEAEIVESDIPFPLERTTIPDQTLTVFATSAIRALREQGRSSRVVWYGEPPSLPYEEDRFDLLEVEDEFKLPIEVQRRINIIRNNNIPIKQVLIAHEHPSRSQALLEAQKREERDEKVHQDLSRVGRALAWATGALAVGAAVVAALPLIIMTLGAVAMAGAFLYCVANGFDPVVVVILDDEASSWVEVGMWYE